MELSEIHINRKPDACGACRFNTVGQGFVPDWWPRPDVRVAFLAEAPASNEVMDRVPLVGPSGKVLTHCVERAGYTRNDIALCNTLRCQVANSTYPIGQLKHDAERCCRQWDSYENKTMDPGGLDRWNPTMFLITIHPAICLRTWNLLQMLQADVEKAFRIVGNERLLVLLGDHSLKMVFPECPDGNTKWRGHYGKLDWSKVKARYAV